MIEKPSKYHRWYFIGKGNENTDENGYGYRWDGSHEELESTSTFEIGGNHYCAYCRNKAYPIQAGLRGSLPYDKHYDTTGYTCICESAETEKQYSEDAKFMKERHFSEVQQLREKYEDRLLIDNVEILKMEQQHELSLATRYKGTQSYFTSLNKQSIKL